MLNIKVGGVPEHFNYPWHIALEEGLFEKENLNISWKDFYGGTGQLSKSLINGEIDIALMLTEGVVKEIVDGSPFVILQNYISSPLIWGIYVAANSEYQYLEELENTTAAISRYGSGSHLLTYVNAKNQGWDTEELNFEVVKNLDGALEALPENKAQYFMWEHFTTKPWVDNGTFRRVSDFLSPWPCFVIATKKDFFNNHQTEINSLLKVLNGVTRNFKSVEGIKQKLAKHYNQKENDIEEWLSKTEWGQAQVSRKTIEIIQNQLHELGLIDKKLPFKDFIANS